MNSESKNDNNMKYSVIATIWTFNSKQRRQNIVY